MGTAIVGYGACALIKGIMRDEAFLSRAAPATKATLSSNSTDLIIHYLGRGSGR